MAHERTFEWHPDGSAVYYVSVLEIQSITFTDVQNGTFVVSLLGISSKTFNSQQAAQDEVDLWRVRIEDAR